MGFYMAVWLVSCFVLGTVIYFWHKRKTATSEQVGAVDEYSNMVLYFDPIRGEGHLFVGGTLVIIFFSLFCHELAKILVAIFLPT